MSLLPEFLGEPPFVPEGRRAQVTKGLRPEQPNLLRPQQANLRLRAWGCTAQSRTRETCGIDTSGGNETHPSRLVPRWFAQSRKLPQEIQGIVPSGLFLHPWEKFYKMY